MQLNLIHSAYRGLVLTLLIGLSSQIGNSQNLWVVSNDASVDADYDNVQSAVTAAAAGDKIYVHGSAANYPSFFVDKKLHIIGSGYWKTENMIPDLNTNPTRVNSSITFSPGSNGSILEGFHITGDLNIDADSIIGRYNRYGVTSFLNKPHTCLIYGSIMQTYDLAPLLGAATNTLIYNNILTKVSGNPPVWGGSDLNSGCVLSHNSISEIAIVQNCSAYNNIFNTGVTVVSFVNVGITQNNIFTADVTGLDTTNLINADINTIWNLADPSEDGKYQLIGDTMTNPAFNFANDGSDAGAFGGTTPYRLSGIVRIPTIYSMIIPLAGDTTNMLNVRIRAKSN